MTSEASLPTGTVTLLLGDVEGSTRAWEADPTKMAAAMARVRDDIADVVAADGGVQPVEQGEGDSFVAAFAKATDAVAAALDLQLRLHGGRVAIRLGLHTGEVLLRDDLTYAGPALNRAARLRDLGHGGQILLSRPTADLVSEALPSGAQLIDLGSHRLKDLTRPEQVFQLSHPDVGTRFPPLRSLDPAANNLPTQLTTFIGRDSELAELRGLLDEHRLVTLLGPGGSGKTRLAVQLAAEVAEEFPDGIWFVDLAPLGIDAVPSALAAVLGLRQEGQRSPTEAAVAALSGRRSLVVFDNCEHVVGAVATLVEALLRARNARVLCTSRETLGVAGEVTWRIPPLARADAVALFVERAARTRPGRGSDDESAVATICDRVEGMPLAIELAAARSAVLTPAQIADGLDDCLRMLGGGPRRSLERHQTLAACLAWSHDLLSDDERALLRRLSVFAGGFDLDGAQAAGDVDAAVALDLLASLVDKSWVVVDQGDAVVSRYRLLEPLRQFAAARLVEAGEDQETRDRHVQYYTRLLRQAGPHLESGAPDWLARVDVEYDNIAGALDHVMSGADARAKVRLVAPLVFYWPARGRYRDGLQWLEQALAFTTDHPATRIQLLLGAAVLAMQLSNRPLAGQRATEALELATSMEEPRAIAWALQVIGMSRARDEADSLQQQSLFERVLEFDPEAIGPAPYHWAATMLAWLRWGAGDLRSARELVSDSVRTCRASGIPTRLADLLRVFGGIEVAMGNLQEAEQPLAEGLALSIQVGLREVEGGVLGMLARLEAARGAWDRALELVDQAASVSGGDATLGAQLEAGHQRSAILRHLGRVREANDLLARCIAGPHAGRVLWQSENEVLLGELLRLAGELSSAKAILEEAVERLSSHGHHLVAAEGRLVLARVARDERELSDAQDLVHGALTFFAEAGALLDLIDSLEVLAGVLGTLENHAEAARLFAAADTIRERVGYVRPPVEQPGYDTDVAALHEALGQGAFEAAWAEGTTLSTDDAVAYARRGRGERRRPSAGWDSLTPTEAKVVGLVAEGLSNPEIAERMFVARATVRTHLSHVFAKLGVSSRAELAAQAARRHQ